MLDIDKPIPSPCVSVCALDENDICIGCYRSADEIRQWSILDNGQKKGVIQLAHDREKRVNPFL
ncbi:MAG: DUF1289 domain-containing protein [Cellvibrionaceae bacterium]